MTAPELFGYLLLGVSVQAALVGLVAVGRHMRSYRRLKKRLSGYDGSEITPEVRAEIKSQKKVLAHGASWEGFRPLKVSRKVFENIDRSVCSFYLEPVDGDPLPKFLPGQFLTFHLDVADPQRPGAHKTLTRCYSLSDGPGKPYFRVSIKREGLGSSHFHDHVREGDVLAVKAPSGHFFLEPGDEPIVLVGGGIGITPMLSMLEASLSGGSTREIWLFYGVRHGGEQVMRERLEALAAAHPNFKLHICYSRPSPQDALGRDFRHEGRVDVTLLRLTLDFKPYEFYICGPGPLMETLVPALDTWGVPDAHIHYEAFGPATVTRTARQQAEQVEEEGFSVTFSGSGKTVAWGGGAANLLEFAERQGVRMESGCRAGGCGACQVELAAGQVIYNASPDFDPEPGSCLPCVCRPASDVTLGA